MAPYMSPLFLQKRYIYITNTLLSSYYFSFCMVICNALEHVDLDNFCELSKTILINNKPVKVLSQTLNKTLDTRNARHSKPQSIHIEYMHQLLEHQFFKE